MSEPTKTGLGTDITLVREEHVQKYLETNGEIGGIWNGAPILLLTTKGRKSGNDRIIPIIYTPVDDMMLIVASKGGAPQHPVWYLNVLGDPHVKVQIMAEKFDAIARTVESPERERLWAECARAWPNYDAYQARTERKIPVVAITRTTSMHGAPTGTT